MASALKHQLVCCLNSKDLVASTLKHQVGCCLNKILAPKVSEKRDGIKVIPFLKMKGSKVEAVELNILGKYEYFIKILIQNVIVILCNITRKS